MNLVDDNGVLGIVLPVSFLADEASSNLRKYVFNKLQVHTVDIYSAEDRLFEFADIGVATFVGTKNSKKSTEINITWKDKESKSDNHIENSEFIRFDGRYQGNSLPVNFGRIGIKLQETLKENATFQSLENQNFIWAGREVDETGLKAFLGKSGNIQLAKGGNISSYSSLSDLPWLEMAHDEVPKSINKTRIGWRDVSRASQKRRIIATLIPEGILTGNSLNITYIKNEPRGDFIYWLLAIMSSLVFESQLRSILATDHVSLSAIRRVAIPSYLDENYDEIVEYSKLSILEEKIHPRLECLVAHSYKMKNDSWLDVLNAFPKLTEYERDELMQEWMSK
jgi:Alw26I/Eco31I/Esp3I family type II restriction m6 adenine DNA methyltransferase